MDVATTEEVSWWKDERTPAPRRTGKMIYCPHSVVEMIKVPKKRAKQPVVVFCKFKTFNLRKYRRHYIRNHGDLTAL